MVFISETHIRNLRKHTKIWDSLDFRRKKLGVGKMYGYQWVKWDKYDVNTRKGSLKHSHINQIQNVIDLIKTNPDSRRMVVSAWNPSVLNKIALPSCHAFFYF